MFTFCRSGILPRGVRPSVYRAWSRYRRTPQGGTEVLGNCSLRCSRQLLLHCSTFARPWSRAYRDISTYPSVCGHTTGTEVHVRQGAPTVPFLQ